MPEPTKTGKTANDIFASTTIPVPPPTNGTDQPSRGPGRPPVHDEAWSKVTVILLNRHVVFLDRLSADIRERTGLPVKRAELIRALIDAVAASDLDLTSAGSESEVRSRISERLAAS